MAGRVLLIEPYVALAEMLALYLEDLGYVVTIADATSLDASLFTHGEFDIALVNLDQGHDAWANAGLALAERARNAGISVVMIPDCHQARDVLDEHNWVYLSKPFNLSTLDEAIRQAVNRPTQHRLTGN